MVMNSEKYLPAEEAEKLKTSGWRVHNLINGYGRYLRNRKANETGVLHDLPSTGEQTVEDDPF